MQIGMPFLTQYKGGTRRSAEIATRTCWTAMTVEIGEIDADDLELGAVINKKKLWHYDGSYWLPNQHHFGDFNDSPRFERNTRVDDLSSTDLKQVAFEIGAPQFLDPGHAIEGPTPTPNRPAYAPGGEVEWDDTDTISRRFRRHCAENLRLCDGVVMMRLRTPCLFVSLTDDRTTNCLALTLSTHVDWAAGRPVFYPGIHIPLRRDALEDFRSRWPCIVRHTQSHDFSSAFHVMTAEADLPKMTLESIGRALIVESARQRLPERPIAECANVLSIHEADRDDTDYDRLAEALSTLEGVRIDRGSTMAVGIAVEQWESRTVSIPRFISPAIGPG